jgi:UDP-4-amino-4-deoxy-L-arabinose-oxoglutarate aminotransferase
MTVLGWKYNMDNIHAALLLPQMDRLENNWRKRAELARRYERLLAGVPGVELPRTHAGARHARHLFPAWVPAGRREAVLRGLHDRGVGVVVNYRAIHLLSFFRERFGFRPGDFPNAERIGDRTVSLPFYPSMPAGHVDLVVEALRASLQAPGRLAA